jgi:hypothetical protein
MSKNTSIVTTISGFLGGSSKVAHEVAVQHSTDSIDFVKVAVAAAISAAVGYAIKLVFDAIVNAIKKRMKR